MMEKLNKFAGNITSQHGEDGIIKYILSHTGAIPKICLEVGAWDGMTLSNVYSLWHDEGWQAILIEGNGEREKLLREKYKGFNIKSFNMFIEPEGEKSLDSIFRDNNIEPEIGILSVDIDSYDYFIWKHLTYVNPVMVIIEHNHTIPPYINYHDPEGFSFMKCSAKALEELGKEKGYKLICCTLTNSIFIRNDKYSNEYFPGLPVEALFDYSSCAAVELNGFSAVNTFRNNKVYHKAPSDTIRLICRIKGFINSLLGKRKRPPAEIIDACRKAGIEIF